MRRNLAQVFGGGKIVIDNLNGDYDRLVSIRRAIQDLLLELSL